MSSALVTSTSPVCTAPKGNRCSSDQALLQCPCPQRAAAQSKGAPSRVGACGRKSAGSGGGIGITLTHRRRTAPIAPRCRQRFDTFIIYSEPQGKGAAAAADAASGVIVRGSRGRRPAGRRSCCMCWSPASLCPSPPQQVAVPAHGLVHRVISAALARPQDDLPQDPAPVRVCM